MSKSPLTPSAPDFDSPDYEASQPIKQEKVTEPLEQSFFRLHLADHAVKARRRAAEDAVDACISTCLQVTDMQYVPRDDYPVTSTSLAHSSWEPEAPPQPCAPDSWLRAALPETTPVPSASTSSNNYAMQQFLKKDGSFRNSPRRTGSPTNGSRPVSRAALNTSRSAKTPTGPVPKPATSKAFTPKELSPDQEVSEGQLRQELTLRKQQEETSRQLQKKDQEERAKLASLQKELKGRDYTYDHKGDVVILDSFDPDRTPLDSGPAFKVGAVQDPNEGAVSPRRKGRNGLGPAAKKSGNSPAEAKREAERKLVNDYKRAPSKTQPSAMETMNPIAGVTLRQGAATKQGPLKLQQAGMTREQYSKYLAKQAAQAEQQQESVETLALKVNSGRAGTDGSRGTQLRSKTNSPIPFSKAGLADDEVASVNPLASFGDKYDIMKDAKPKLPLIPTAKPPTPDINVALTTASDWGNSAGGRSFEAAPSLPPIKPTEKQLQTTVGRIERLPRERGPMATMSPPLSPQKAHAQKEYSRLQFHSILSQ